MEIKRTYTLVDIALRLGRARTTLADWSRQFKEFLPTVGSGRSMRYTEEAVEVFGLISKMKDANEPQEYIREHLRGVVTEIIVPMTDNDDGKPYLMQLAGEVDQLKQAVVMLAQRLEKVTTYNDEARRELAEARRETAVAADRLSGRIEDISISIREEIRKSKEDTNKQLGEILSRVETYGKRKKFLGLF